MAARYGFIVMDGNGSLFGTLSGNTREVLHKFTVDLPKKHGRGGQSALRFARLRMEKRHNYVRKVRGIDGSIRLLDAQVHVWRCCQAVDTVSCVAMHSEVIAACARCLAAACLHMEAGHIIAQCAASEPARVRLVKMCLHLHSCY